MCLVVGRGSSSSRLYEWCVLMGGLFGGPHLSASSECRDLMQLREGELP